MTNTVRRLLSIALLAGGAYAVWLFAQSRRDDGGGGEHEGAARWPPLDTTSATTDGGSADVAASDPVDALATDSEEIAAAIPTVDDVRWVAPVDGVCPDGYPIKANDNSGIYHVPGGRFYDRTVPERCYADAGAAEADGYRSAKA